VLLYDQHPTISAYHARRSGNLDAHILKVGKRGKKRHLQLDLGLAYSDIRSADRLSTTTPPLPHHRHQYRHKLSTNTINQDPEFGNQKPCSLSRNRTSPSLPPSPDHRPLLTHHNRPLLDRAPDQELELGLDREMGMGIPCSTFGTRGEGCRVIMRM
jgi:hypothetical protein